MRQLRRLSSARDRRDLYGVLGLDRDADAGQIREAFARRARELHPDTAGSSEGGPAAPAPPELLARLLEARRVLSDPELRRRYDDGGAESFGAGPATDDDDGRGAAARPPPAGRVGPRQFGFGPRGAYARARDGGAGGAGGAGAGPHPWRYGLGGLDRWARRRARRAIGSPAAGGAGGGLAELARDARDVGLVGAALPDALKAALWGAVRAAHEGPDVAGLRAGELPDGFEAETRSDPRDADLMHVVSGRTVLGRVREVAPPPPGGLLRSRAGGAGAGAGEIGRASCRERV